MHVLEIFTLNKQLRKESRKLYMCLCLLLSFDGVMSPELFINSDTIHYISFKRFLQYVKILQKFKRPNSYPPDSLIHWNRKRRLISAFSNICFSSTIATVMILYAMEKLISFF